MSAPGEMLPRVVWSGSFRIWDIEIRCHTLSDGERVIEEESMRRLIALFESDAPMRSDAVGDDILAFSRWRSGQDPL